MAISKDIKYILTALLAFVFEAVLGKYLAIFGIVPNIMLCYFVLASSFEKDFSYVAILGIVFGLAKDVINPHGFFTCLVIYPFSSYITFKLCDSIFSSKRLFVLTDIFVLTIVCELFYFVMHISDMQNIGFLTSLVKIILPSAVYNSVICLVFYPLCKKIFKR